MLKKKKKKKTGNRNEKQMNNTVYLDLSLLDHSKTVTYEFWYHYIKPKYGENAKQCYIGSFTVQVKANRI